MVGFTLVIDLKTVPYLGPSDAETLLLKNNTLFNMSGIESPVWCKLKAVIADGNKISSISKYQTICQFNFYYIAFN